MERRSQRSIILCVIANAILCGGLSSARALDFGPKSFPLKIGGVSIEIPVSGSIDMRGESAAVSLTASALGDLQPIQDRALEIARGLRLPRDNCAHKGVNVVVESLDDAKITPVGKTAVVGLSGRVAVWFCKKVFGQNLKAKIVSDEVSLSAPIELYLSEPRTVALRLAAPVALDAGASFDSEAGGLIRSALSAALTEVLTKRLDTADVRAAVPPLPGLAVNIDSAEFAQDGTKLTVRAKGSATMAGAAYANLLGFIGQ